MDRINVSMTRTGVGHRAFTKARACRRLRHARATGHAARQGSAADSLVRRPAGQVARRERVTTEARIPLHDEHRPSGDHWLRLPVLAAARSTPGPQRSARRRTHELARSTPWHRPYVSARDQAWFFSTGTRLSLSRTTNDA